MKQDRIRAAQEAIVNERYRGGSKVLAIDPYHCGCTECIIGEYVPLEQATDDQLIAMILGELANHTGYEVTDFFVNDDGSVLKPTEPERT